MMERDRKAVVPAILLVTSALAGDAGKVVMPSVMVAVVASRV